MNPFYHQMKRIFYVLICALITVACEDDGKFSSGSGMRLDFQVDTLKMDTVFSGTPSSTYAFWVHNRQESGIILKTVRLKKGNQTGYRANVDGIYLDNSNGSQISNVEIRRKDSILVFVELTAQATHQQEPKLVEEDLLFSLENGNEQSVNLRAWAWDAQKLYDPEITKDTLIESDVPLVIYGDMTIHEGVTLTLRNTRLFFHDNSGMEVYGSLKMEGCELRGDRLDRMFDYLPYDRVSGQWKGLHFYESSVGNEFVETAIKNTMDGVVLDSAMLDPDSYRLQMRKCVVHNCQGDGVRVVNSKVRIDHCQLTNTEGDCLTLYGGMAEISYCTIAQFYPFSANRGAAVRLASEADLPLKSFYCEGTIATGYEENVLKLEQVDEEVDYLFSNCLLRAPVIEDSHFADIIWESPSDEIQGKNHFVKIDEENQNYDFHLNDQSTDIGLGCY